MYSFDLLIEALPCFIFVKIYCLIYTNIRYAFYDMKYYNFCFQFQCFKSNNLGRYSCTGRVNSGLGKEDKCECDRAVEKFK